MNLKIINKMTMEMLIKKNNLVNNDLPYLGYI